MKLQVNKVSKPVDHRKELKQIYQLKQGNMVIQDLPERCYVSQRMHTKFDMEWDGRPEPLDDTFTAFKIVNQIKQITKTEMNYRFKRMPDEIIWLSKNEKKSLVEQMIYVPPFITEDIYSRALLSVQKKLKLVPPLPFSFIRVPSQSVALKLHEGHYKDAGETLEVILKELQSKSIEPQLPHREIFLCPAMDCYPAAQTKTVICVPV
ncbi:GyrI-like domain-containing protein [Alkalihalobacillus pseudalcaliphilus]|uniref:GyrI-like domain-containing protein n=1 Tax=Alkalihalobacillus pseudalcaliphilus TaxID=79884 RepID=UPI00064DEECD|nr:GyrI-like domain-containing protein [Alkalihalobacillus pseudalcaliphilus]KMK77179.1 hypothetical protein AB990_06415 [Alkalihalobacillus pseudalcaliphilus]